MCHLLLVRPSYTLSHILADRSSSLTDSIINATDFTLPKKPCRTCKNRFHAGCLYKVRPQCQLSWYHILTLSAVVQHQPHFELSSLPLRHHID